MQPRLAADGKVIGKRRRSSSSPTPKKRTRTSKSLPPVLQLCQCMDCVFNPGTDPATGLPVQGRYLMKTEHRRHRTEQNQRGVAMLRLEDDLTPPELDFGHHNHTYPGALASPPSASTSTPPLPPPPLVIPPVAPTTNDILSQLKILAEALREPDQVIDSATLKFLSPPTAFSAPLTDASPQCIRQACELDPTVRTNFAVLDYEEYITKTLEICEEHREAANIHVRLRSKGLEHHLQKHQQRLSDIKLAQWEQQRIIEVSQQTVVDSAIHYIRPLLDFNPAVLGCYLLVATLHLVCGLSVDHCNFVLKSLRIILETVAQTTYASVVAIAPQSIFSDVRTVVDVLGLKPRATAYVCCPKCFSIYWIDPNKPKDYPETCINREAGDELCGAKLRKNRRQGNGHTSQQPVREYMYQNMPDWVGRLYAREDLRKYLHRDLSTGSHGDDDLWDIWDAPGLREFLGPDGKTPFWKGGKEGRLIFSMNMDGFNPYGNKEAGKKISMGGIYMVCLNLPPAIRYNPENMFLVAVIPGPQEPSAHQINYLLKPLVDDLLVFWETGVYYPKVPGYPNGLLVRCAIVPLVCDLKAARQMSGAAGFGSEHFCSFCKQTRDDINNLDYTLWVPRTNDEHRRAAKGWLNAKTRRQREKWYKVHGVRWSELLRLPYWDPTKFTIIDSMHGFYLRLFSRHVRDIWGMDIKFDDGDGITFDLHPKHPTEAEMQDAHKVLEQGTLTQLRNLRSAVLKQLCQDTTTLDWRGPKGLLFDRLVEYRIRQGWFEESGRPLESSSAQGPARGRTVHASGNSSKKAVTATTDQQLFAEDTFEHATKTQIYKLRKAELVLVLSFKISNPTAAELEKWHNNDLRVKIQTLRKAAGIIDDKEVVISESKKGTRVLGRETLAEIRSDMDLIQLPSWVSAAPAHPGEAKWGKLSADHWRTFCMVNLPITLIRLWGDESQDSRKHRMLVNFMHLVSAVKLATARRITEENIIGYERHMHAYLTSLLELYPGTNISPYQHLSLHFGPLLRQFGPTHAWRCFPFERYNYLMQNVPTNGHLGEMAKTLFYRFTMAQNMRTLFHEDNLPVPLRPLVSLFEKTFKSDIRGTLLNDLLSFDGNFKKIEETVTWAPEETSRLREHIYQLLRSWISANDPHMGTQPIYSEVYFRPYIGRLGQRFHKHKTSAGDSHVVFGRNGDDWSAGRICEIFSHTRKRSLTEVITQTFVVIQPYASLSENQIPHDHYRDFPIIGGRAFKPHVGREILLSIDEVICHFVRYPGKGCFLALPMDRVRPSTTRGDEY